MRKIFLMGIALSVAFAAPVFAGSSDDEAIRNVVTTFAQSWDKHDIKAMASAWSEDGDLINPAGRVAKGREEVEKLLTFEHTGPFKASRMKMTVDTIRYFGDVALVDVTAVISGQRNPKGKVQPPLNHHVFWVGQKKDDQWSMVSCRPYIFMKAPAAAKMAKVEN